MGKCLQLLYIAVFIMSTTIMILGEETNETSGPDYDYVKVFRYIPTFLEYLLDTLQEWPEILERNDGAVYKRSTEGSDGSDEDKNRNNIGDVDNYEPQSVSEDKEGVKRKVRDSTDMTETISNEYSNGVNFLEPTENYNSVKKVNIDDESITTHVSNMHDIADFTPNLKKVRKSNPRSNPTKKLSHKNGESFTGFDNFFALDVTPEEIEERILFTEQLLEEHNNSKNK